jgi:2-polyprenyl-3-methyl-5-hydroxy-6-metoxy-1,4-benzoquinol methylase
MMPDNRNRIAEYYNIALPQLKKDTDRLGIIKVKLGSIVKSGETILDLGCGSGITSKFMAQLGAKVTAVDISPKLIEYARENNAHKNVNYFCADITEPEPGGKNSDKKFDGIVMVDVFEHLPRLNIQSFVLTIERHSSDHTWLFLNIPDGRYQAAAQKHIPEKLQIIDESYSINELLTMFDAIDFDVLDINIYGIESPCQYNTFLFQRKGMLDKAYKESMCGKEVAL